MRLAAITALYNSLEFVRKNFERQNERDFIMQVVCEATKSPDVAVVVAAFECLVRIMSLYYDKMALYMQQALFAVCDSHACTHRLVDNSRHEEHRRNCRLASD